jgi:small redox-active disulfide protein 2
MHIKVLGSGCAKCHSLEDKVRKVVEENSIDAVITKVTDIQQIMSFGIMMTPGLVINEKVVCTGSVPKDDQILKWLKEAE